MENEFYLRYIRFLKEHSLYKEEVFQYIYNQALLFDYYLEEEGRNFIGCFCIYNKKYLSKINIFVPYIVDSKTVLVNIHEYVHAFLLYSKLGTKYKVSIDQEVLPIFFEKVYMLEYPSLELTEYKKYLNQLIKENDLEYHIALELQDELLKKYKVGMNVHRLDKKVKRLVKRKEYNLGNIN